ncbi:MAG: hypothetical protein ACD_63C00039G0003 [uncultured bacterium]|nr:MAG: hypothetical protein ACD_63C00039G0003 [uncultured bacterium]
MYYYIYDSYVADGKYKKLIAQIETTLTDLDIAGEREKVTPIRPVQDLVKIALERDIKTVILVGNDYTFTKALNASLVLGMHPEDIVFGIIPIGEPNRIANMLGIPSNASACQEIARRKLDSLDLGKVNKRFFITTVDVGFEAEYKTRKDLVQERIGKFSTSRRIKKYKVQPVRVVIDNQYQIKCDLFNVSVINLSDTSFARANVNPKDKVLNVCVVPYSEKIFKKIKFVVQKQYEKLPDASIFKAEHVRIDGPKIVKIATDGVLYDVLPLEIDVIPKVLKVIVGKGRVF